MNSDEAGRRVPLLSSLPFTPLHHHRPSAIYHPPFTIHHPPSTMSDQSAQDPGGSQGPTRHTPARTVSETFSDGGNDTEREVDIGRASRERQLSQASSSAEQSLSTTPTQSAITGAPKSLLSQHPHGTGVGPSARPAEQEAAWARPNSPTMERVKNVRHEEFAGHSARESSQATSMGGSQSGTIGRGAAPVCLYTHIQIERSDTFNTPR